VVSPRRDAVAGDLHKRVMAACADGLAEQLAVLHGPQRRPKGIFCPGCDRAPSDNEGTQPLWPCRTYKILTAHVLELRDVDAALKAMLLPKLTTPQVTLMRFFAGQLPDPPRHTCEDTYQVLIARGLIERQGPRRVYQLTERGQHHLAVLGPGLPRTRGGTGKRCRLT
jgi:hypothetical protein